MLPDYEDGSIVNLMASIEKELCGKPQYNGLDIFSEDDLKCKNILLIVIDGLGYEWLMKNAKNSVMARYLRGSITSIFPAGTAACVTSFATGVPVQQHAITGWFTYINELDYVAIPLRSCKRGSDLVNPRIVKVNRIKTLDSKINATPYCIVGKEIVDSIFTRHFFPRSKRIGYDNLKGYFRAVREVIKINNERKYIYAYWPRFDEISHMYGTNSRKLKEHFLKIDKEFSILIKRLEGTNTALILTADHGLTNSKTIKIDKTMQNMLLQPLSGERRIAYCYTSSKDFESYVKKKYGKYCRLYKSSLLLKEGYFGRYKQNKNLLKRIGDYILVMKEGYAIIDVLKGEGRYANIGNHGGVSKEEMKIPLIFAKI